MPNIRVPASGGSSTSTAAWQTAVDFDFTTKANQAIANGNNAIGGLNWWGENVANASSFQVINGTGLQMQASPAAASNYWAGLRTAPILSIPMPTLIPGFEWSQAAAMRLIVTATFSAAPISSEEGFNVSLEANSQGATFSGNTFAALSHVQLGAAMNIRVFNGSGNFVDLTEVTDPTAGTDNQFVLHTPLLPAMRFAMMTTAAGGGGAPSMSNWRFRGYVDDIAQAVVQTMYQFRDPNSLAVALSIRNGGFPGNPNLLTANVQRVRVDYVGG